MAPAGVEGDGEVGIVLAGHRSGELGGVAEPVEVDRPALDLAGEREVEHLVRPLAHRGRAEQAAERFAGIVHRASEFPEVPADDRAQLRPSLGAPSGVK